MHDRGVMLAGEDVAGPAHVSRELIHLFDAFDRAPGRFRITQIIQDELVRHGPRILVLFQIDATDPKSFTLEALHQVAPDEASSPTDNDASHSFPFHSIHLKS